MTEIEKLESGLPFSVRDSEVDKRKLSAVRGCQKLNSVDIMDNESKERAIRELFGSAGKEPVVNKDVPSNSLVGGVPAKIIRELINDVED